MAVTPRVPRFTPEESSAWQRRKMEQWARIQAAFAPPEGEEPELHVTMIQTKDTFMVYARGDDFADDFCLGQPAHNVTRDDRLLSVPATDIDDDAVDAAILAWKSRRKVAAIDPLHGKGAPSRQ